MLLKMRPVTVTASDGETGSAFLVMCPNPECAPTATRDPLFVIFFVDEHAHFQCAYCDTSFSIEERERE